MLTVQFVISPDGTVSSSSATGDHEGIASCVADMIKPIEFPEPKGGGSVQVTIPFTFH